MDNGSGATNVEVLPETSARLPAPSVGNGLIQASVLEQAAIAEIKVAAELALIRPRHVAIARERIMDACKRPAFAAAAIYEKPVGGSKIRGLSIRFAEEAARSWGNVKFQKFAILDDAETRVVKVCGWDMETGVSYSEDVVIRKEIERKSSKGREVISERVNSYGEAVFLVRATDDEMQNREGALVSKSIRNIALRLIPEDIQAEAKATCMRAIAGHVEKDRDTYIRQIQDRFAQLGVRAAQLADYLGHDLSQATTDELAELVSIGSTIADRETTWAAITEQRKAETETSKPDIAEAKVTRTAKPMDPGPDKHAAPEPEKDNGQESVVDERTKLHDALNTCLQLIDDCVEGQQAIVEKVLKGLKLQHMVRVGKRGDGSPCVLIVGIKTPKLALVVEKVRGQLPNEFE